GAGTEPPPCPRPSAGAEGEDGRRGPRRRGVAALRPGPHPRRRSGAGAEEIRRAAVAPAGSGGGVGAARQDAPPVSPSHENTSAIGTPKAAAMRNATSSDGE